MLRHKSNKVFATKRYKNTELHNFIVISVKTGNLHKKTGTHLWT